MWENKLTLNDKLTCRLPNYERYQLDHLICHITAIKKFGINREYFL